MAKKRTAKTVKVKQHQKPIYMIWVDDSDSTGYWETFETIEDAVSSHGDSMVFEATPKVLGVYTIQSQLVKKPAKEVKAHG